MLFPFGISHTDFLPLVNERNSSEEKAYGTKHLDSIRCLSIRWQKSGCPSWLIVIFNDIRLKAILLCFLIVPE